MINLIKMEFFRLFKSKTTYITFLFVIIFSFILFGMSCTLGEQSEAGNLEENNVMYTEVSDDEAVDIKGGAGVGFVAASFTSDTSVIFECLVENFLSSGVFLIFIGIFATNTVCNKYKSGFQKNLNIYSKKKWQLIVSENLPLIAFAAIEIILIALIYMLCSVLYFNDFSIGSKINIIRYLAMQILMHYAFATLIMCIAELIRGKVVGITVTCMLGLGFGTLVTNNLDRIFGLEKFSITEHTVVYNVKLMPIKFDGELWGTAIAVVIFAVIVYNVISALIVSNRDMA